MIWAAGLYEGEGNVSRQGYTAFIQLLTTDEDVAERFAAAIGGRTNGPYQREGNKPYWKVALYGWDELHDVFRSFEPWLGERRRRDFEAVLAAQHEPRPKGTSEPCGMTTPGSQNGYARHVRRREAPCQPCRDAKAAYQKKRNPTSS